MTALHFAHVTDIHLTARTESWGALGQLADNLFVTTVNELNEMDDLDFVLITGDVMDQATELELNRFMDIIRNLRVPWHFVPGNHDGFYDPEHPDAFAPHEAIPVIDSRLANPRPDAQRAHWSRPAAPGVQLIGLDSRMPDHWNGEINEAQMDWLQRELDAHRDAALILIAVHHPLHALMAKDRTEPWSNFICENGDEVCALLDEFPNVQMVLAGHHHAHQLRWKGERLHINTAALSGYPCVYRTIRLEEQAGGWQVDIATHSPADEGQRKRALDKMEDSETADKFNPRDHSAWPTFAAGRPEDQGYSGRLSGEKAG